MFAFINQFFAALSSIFKMTENFANSGVILSEVAKDKADAYQQEERIKIRAKLLKLQADAAKDPTLVIDAE